jgi:hypothetical protein
MQARNDLKTTRKLVKFAMTTLNVGFKLHSDRHQIKLFSKCKMQSIACGFTDVQTVDVAPAKG